MKHVLQEDPLGCLAATFAMVLGITYEEACQKFGGHPDRGHSYYCDVWDQQMTEHGWLVARKWQVIQPGNRKRSTWPLEPWADLHECEVKTSMIHSVLMLRDGTVIDPLTPEPKRLSDYSAVLSMAALYNLKALAESRQRIAELEAELKNGSLMFWPVDDSEDCINNPKDWFDGQRFPPGRHVAAFMVARSMPQEWYAHIVDADDEKDSVTLGGFATEAEGRAAPEVGRDAE